MGKFLRTMGILLMLCICQSASGATWYVDGSVPESGDGTSWETSLKTIQEGIDVPSDGDIVLVAEGIYTENVQLKGKNIVLSSTDGLGGKAVSTTIIDGNQSGSAVTFAGTEDETCVLSGFTIRNGAAENGGGVCGGTSENHTHAVIQKNAVANNSGFFGGGLAFCDGAIRNNTISGNSASVGGGLADCNGLIQNNIIEANSANICGGGLFHCDAFIRNNIVCGNSAVAGGGGLSQCQGTVVNCIIWWNVAGSEPQAQASIDPIYSCIQNWQKGGEGNVSVYPYFVDHASGDYHLQSWSPCIDAGDPSSPFSSEPQPNGGRVNMGAYGNTSEATPASKDTDEDLLPDDWEMNFFGHLAHGSAADPDADAMTNIEEYDVGRNPSGRDYVTWFVNGSVPLSGYGGSWRAAFRTIQEGIDATSDGDTVIVVGGTYVENIQFNGNNIVLCGTNPLELAVVANTIIDGSQSGPVVTFTGDEDETCVLSGFTIQNGLAQQGGGICGGTREHRTRATIRNNIITGNSADSGAGLAFCDGTIQNNMIVRNGGDGLSRCHGIIQNNTIVGNTECGLCECWGVIRNCIVWGNTAGWAGGWGGCVAPTHSCIQEWDGGGEGNIADNPRFVNEQAGDYRLQPDSPCIDAGANYYWFVWPQRDLDGDCRLAGDRVDMGCYEFGSSPDFDGDLLSNEDEAGFGTDPDNEDTDGDGLRDGLESLRGSDSLAPTAPRIVHVPSEITKVQAALCLAVGGDEIVAASGTYCENLQFCGPDVALRSSDPEDADVVASTVLDGSKSGPVVSFTGNENGQCAIVGLTIRNGSTGYGGGIRGGTQGNHTRATIRNNTIAENSAHYPIFHDVAGDGGGIAYCDGIIEGNTITKNVAGDYGGGLAYCDGIVQENVITENTAQYGGALSGCHGTIQNNIVTGNGVSVAGWSPAGVGGAMVYCHGVIQNNKISGNVASRFGAGLAYCHGTIQNNIISGNSAGESGGGLAYCDGVIQKNTISGNSANKEGGGGLSYCEGTIVNNVIYDNSTDAYGGGLLGCGAPIQNNTICLNSASEGGGLYECSGNIINCIIWGNIALDGPQLHNCSVPTYSCVQGWNEGGEGNIALYPEFLDPVRGDVHVRRLSPCIDAGDPSSDFSNEPEPNGGRVNMGAYGNTPEATSKGLDTDLDSLPDDWELQWFGDLDEDGASDPDGDGISNIVEFRYGGDPTSGAEQRVSNITKGSSYPLIGEALIEADHGDEIVVYPGTYEENINFDGKRVVLRSTDPLDADIVASTVIDGTMFAPVVTFSGTEDETCILSGFTIRNGSGGNGGGICGGTETKHAMATIQNNVITGNTAARWGGGIAFCDGTIQGNFIYGNSAEAGGGLSDCQGTIFSNAIIGNSADYGGGLDYCHAAILNNTICGNFAVEKGGGLSECDARILNCIIWGNMAPESPQIYDSRKPAFCCIQGWSALTSGNIANDPRFCDADGPDGNPTTCEDNDYRLSPDSPCVDAGTNEDWMYGAVDLDGKQRIAGGRADMGAYEHVAFAFGIKEVIIAGGNEARLTWSSCPGDSYTIWSCLDLVSATWTEQATISSGGQTTTWTDPDTTPTRKFYRIELK